MKNTPVRINKIKGFTLIELIVVIAIIGILAAALIALIDPVDKINSANDAKVQSDIAQLATAEQSYAANHNGSYDTNFSDLVKDGDLQSIPTPPPNYSCVGGSYLDTYSSNLWLYCNLKSKKFTNNGTVGWQWCSATGKAGPYTGGGC